MVLPRVAELAVLTATRAVGCISRSLSNVPLTMPHSQELTSVPAEEPTNHSTRRACHGAERSTRDLTKARANMASGSSAALLSKVASEIAADSLAPLTRALKTAVYTSLEPISMAVNPIHASVCKVPSFGPCHHSPSALANAELLTRVLLYVVRQTDAPRSAHQFVAVQ